MLSPQAGAPGVLDTPGIPAYPDGMDIFSDPENLPKTPEGIAALPDDTVIGIPVWAHLQGVKVNSVYRDRARCERRREAGAQYAGAMAEFDRARVARSRDASLPEPVAPEIPAAGLPKPGDMPAADYTIGSSPAWKLGTFRAWLAARPGQGTGAGRPPLSEHSPPRNVRLPVECPHCHERITPRQLAEAGTGTGEAGSGSAAA